MEVERSVSPTPSRVSCASQDLISGRAPRRSAAYRLFPTVDPTPPATPVAFQRATLSKAAAASARRRSSSTEIAAKDILSARLHTAAPARTIRDGRKASLPELRPVQAVRSAQETVDPGSIPRPRTARDRAEDHRENLNTDCSLGDRYHGNNYQLSSLAKRDASYSTTSLALSPVSELHSARPRTRTKQRPNLRINVTKHVENKPPTPPPKSPRYPGEDRYREDDALGSPNRLSALTTPHHHSRPQTPVQVAEQQSITPVSGDVKVVWPAAKAGRDPSHKVHSPSPLPSERLEKPLPPITGSRSDQKSHSPPRPQTNDSARVAFPVRSSSMLPVDGSPMKHVKSRTTVAPNSPPRVTLRSRLLPGLRSKTRQASDARPNTPEARQEPLEAYFSDLDEITTRPGHRAATPDSNLGQSRTGGAVPIKDNLAIDNRPGSSRNDRESDILKSSPAKTRSVSEPTTTDEALSRSAAAALAAARANVAALRTSDYSIGSPERVRISGSDAGSIHRSTSDSLSRRPSTSHGLSDPIETLRELSSESEQLHERYASLRAERQKVSSGIIDKLKAQQAGPEYVNTLLDDQLSLAAISSSMDICAAKLKSLDCRREDAIAVLITSATQPQMSPTENIAAMIASMAVSRKPSLATESSRHLPTGRSTPEIGDNFSFNRMTQQSNRTLSYASETESVEYRFPSLSRKASWGAESVHRTDSTERQAPETIPEVVESPDPRRDTHEPETVGNQNEWKSSHPSPARPAPATMESPEDLLGPRLITLETNSKAAKILGLDDKTTAVINELQLLVPNSKSLDDASASLLTARSMTSNDPASGTSDAGDLELQLQSFPKPSRLSCLPTPNKRDTGGSVLTNGSSAESSNDEPELVPPSQRPGRDRSPRPATAENTTAKAASRKRDPSAHTIQVYIPGDEVLDYYNRSRELPLPPLPPLP